MKIGHTYRLVPISSGYAIHHEDGNGSPLQVPPFQGELRIKLWGLPDAITKRWGLETEAVEAALIREPPEKFLRIRLPNGKLPLLELFADPHVKIELM